MFQNISLNRTSHSHFFLCDNTLLKLDCWNFEDNIGECFARKMKHDKVYYVLQDTDEGTGSSIDTLIHHSDIRLCL
uniref:AlNc14C59G4359 protein n=1 Tax=Albugo laibachii Nc14 TaxID=890382 RepID=F0WCH9_9STRA|nr:AlNc14C59G4359 [Albugo laibachii Nc14]|eukprot:CCA18896.1 AlNc14C59G4359 [Albugo laibachii Nc14]